MQSFEKAARKPWFIVSRLRVVGALLAATLFPVLPVSAASFDVTEGAWGDIGTTNSLAWAIHQANSTPGADVIRLFSDVNVDQAEPIPFTGGFLVELTDTQGLSIEGNGHALVGNPKFLSGSGNYIVTKYNPQEYSMLAGDSLFVDALSFAKIASNVSHVSIDRLVVDGLNAFLDVGRGSVATISDSIIRNAVNFGHTARPVLTAQAESILNLTAITLREINPFYQLSAGSEYSWGGAILGEDATLNLLSSTIDLFASTAAGAVNWVGGTANVVSSLVVGEGLSIIDHSKQGVLNIVNSVFRPSGPSATARVQAYGGGVANVIASTLQYDAFYATKIPGHDYCPELYPCNGSPLQVFADGEINLRSSAVSVLYNDLVGIKTPYADVYYSIAAVPLPGTLTADAYSYVQPVSSQDADSLRLLFSQPNLITTANAYVLDPNGAPLPTYYAYPDGAYPNPSGPLVGVIPLADTTNQIINPIDGSVISTDVFGNPRTFNGRRDVGAVQQPVPAPGPLPLLGLGAAWGWSRRLRRRLGE